MYRESDVEVEAEGMVRVGTGVQASMMVMVMMVGMRVSVRDDESRGQTAGGRLLRDWLCEHV